MMKFALAAITVVTAGGSTAHAQGICKGKVSVDTVYQVATSTPGKFEYFVQVRNATPSPVSVMLRFGSFTNVSLFSPTLPVTLKPNASEKIRFGNGTNGTVNTGTVQVLYDALGTGKAFVSAMSCK